MRDDKTKGIVNMNTTVIHNITPKDHGKNIIRHTPARALFNSFLISPGIPLIPPRSQLRWLGYLFWMPPVGFPWEVFQACPVGRRPCGRTRTPWAGLVSPLCPSRAAGEGMCESGSLGISTQTDASAPRPRVKQKRWMNGQTKRSCTLLQLFHKVIKYCPSISLKFFSVFTVLIMQTKKTYSPI